MCLWNSTLSRQGGPIAIPLHKHADCESDYDLKGLPGVNAVWTRVRRVLGP